MHITHCCDATSTLLHRIINPYVPVITTGDSPLKTKGLTTMFLMHLVAIFQQWRRYNDSLRELNQLGDRELADIGITRGDIPRVAWESAER